MRTLQSPPEAVVRQRTEKGPLITSNMPTDSISSEWVDREALSELEKEPLRTKPVSFPIRLDDTVMETDRAWSASIRRSRHISDFRNRKNYDSLSQLRVARKNQKYP